MDLLGDNDRESAYSINKWTKDLKTLLIRIIHKQLDHEYGTIFVHEIVT